MTFGTQIFELWVDTEVKVYRDTFKKDVSFRIYVKIRYENFSFHITVVQLLLTIWKRNAFAWKTTEASKGGTRVVCAMCPRI